MKINKRITGVALAAGLLGGGLAVVSTAPAFAHTPAISASCAGITVTGTAYEANKVNTWFVTIDGVTVQGTFGASFTKTVPVPQDGKTHTYAAQVADQNQTPAYTKAANGPVGPCGPVKPTEPPAKQVPGSSEGTPDCTTKTVTIKNWRDDYTYTYDQPSNTYKETVTRVNLPDTSRAATEAECPTPVATPTPEPTHTTPAVVTHQAPPAPPAATLAETGTREEILRNGSLLALALLVLGGVAFGISKIKRA